MKKNFVIAILFALVTMLGGCEQTVETYPVENNDVRFQITYSQNTDNCRENGIFVIHDKETGVNYLFVKKSQTGGLTKLEE